MSKDNQPKQTPFYKLPVYNTVRMLTIQFQLSTQKTRRTFKYGPCADVEYKLVDLMSKICFAHDYKEDKQKTIQFIQKAIDTINYIKIRIRILYDLQAIKPEGFDIITNLEADVSTQLNFWLKSEMRNKV